MPYRLPAIAQFPRFPATPPLDWRWLGDSFARYVDEPAHGVRYTDPAGRVAFTAFLEGTHYGTSRHELVSLGPIALGKLLRGEEDRALLSSLGGYFNPTLGVFLNSPGNTRSELWYLMYAAALAGHLIRRCGEALPEGRGWWQATATTLRRMAQRLDYDFNHQGYDFAADAPWTDRDEYRQPDAVGGYAYLILLSYRLLGDTGYLEEAVAALARYVALPANPWYEVPDGTLAALAAAWLAQHEPERLADATGALQRCLNWLFDPQAALATGSYGPCAVDGLMRGWRHSTPESVYSMESLMVLPWLLPVARHAREYAADIGRYALHVAANARWFYGAYMGAAQSRPDLTPAVPYERLLAEHAGGSPYALGDFQGHKSIYGGAYSLWWGALVQRTSDPLILQLDVTATDALDANPRPAWLVYNPYPRPRQVAVRVGGTTVGVELPPDSAQILEAEEGADGKTGEQVAVD